MRKLPLLATLCLILVATATPTRKVKASEFGGSGGAACTAAMVSAVAFQVAYQATCKDHPNTSACDDALDKYLDAESEMQIMCAPR